MPLSDYLTTVGLFMQRLLSLSCGKVCFLMTVGLLLEEILGSLMFSNMMKDEDQYIKPSMSSQRPSSLTDMNLLQH